MDLYLFKSLGLLWATLAIGKKGALSMRNLICHQFAYLSDNYGVLLHCPETGKTAAIDAGDAKAYQDELAKTGYHLDEIWVTHHHWDHTDGLADLKKATGAEVIGPDNTKEPIAALIDEAVNDGDEFSFAGRLVNIIRTPGHTLDMVNFYLPSEALLFSGDSLFVLGCGRLFEGDGSMMWHSLSKLRALPDDVTIYSSHEYSLANAAFALSIEPENKALQERAKQIEIMRAQDKPTVPSLMRDELATNPFLRPDSKAIRDNLSMQDASDEAVFTEIRKRKDNF